MARRRCRSRTIRALLVAGVAVWAVPVTAQQSPCEEACAAEEKRCVETCGSHRDPVECESTCRTEAWECRNRCREQSGVGLDPQLAAGPQPLACVSTVRRSRSE